MFCRTVERCGCKSGPVELAWAASRYSVALVVRPRVGAWSLRPDMRGPSLILRLRPLRDGQVVELPRGI
jgi:hypothetical protein